MLKRLAQAGLLIAAVGGLLIVAPVSHGAPTSAWYWEWSDGSRAKTRVLSETRLTALTSLPGLTVASAPAAPERSVELLVRHEGRWVVEDAARTDRAGVAHLALNPYCGNGDWCSATADYRLRVDGITASLRVRFTSAKSSAGQ